MISETKNHLFQVFTQFDKDNSGFIDVSELQEVAKQLNTELKQQEIDKVLKVVDTNKDGKISFEEFWQWWQFGKNEKLEFLVFQKLKLMNLIKKVHSEFTRYGISIEQKYDNQIDNHYMALNYGDNAPHFKINSILNIKSKGLDNVLKDLNLGQLELQEKQSIQVQLVFRSQQPLEAKLALDQLIKDVRELINSHTVEELEGEIEMLFNEEFTEIKVIALENQVAIYINLNNPIVHEMVLQQYIPFMQMLGDETEVFVDLNFGIKNGLGKMMKKNQIFVKYLLEGFLLELKLRFNSGLARNIFHTVLQMFSAMLETSKKKNELIQAFTLPMLLKTSKFHLQFRNIDDVDSFLRCLNLSELAEDQASGRELIQEIFDEQDISELKDPTHYANMLYRLYKILGQHTTAIGSLYVVVPYCLLQVNFQASGLNDVFEVMFRDDPESIKKKEEKDKQKKRKA